MDSKGPNIFQTLLLVFFGLTAVVALLIFSGFLPGFREKKVSTSEMTVLWGWIPEGDFGRVLNEYNDKNLSPLNVRYEYHGKNDYDRELTEAMASGKGPDLFFVDSDMIIKNSGKILKIPYSSYPVRNFQDTFVDAAKVFMSPDGLFGLPLGVDPLVMYYNREMLSGAGLVKIPNNWSDVLVANQKITSVDERHNIKKSFIAFGGFSNVNNAKDVLLTLLLQAGNPMAVFNDDGLYVVTLGNDFGLSPTPAEAAMTFFIQFADPLKSTYSWNRSLPRDSDAFASGQLATYFGFASEQKNIIDQNPHLDLDVAIVPQKSIANISYGRLTGLALAKNSNKISSALTAAYVLTNDVLAAKLDDILGIVPASRDLLSQTQDDPSRVIFYKAAVSSRAFLDPDRERSRDILSGVVENIKSGSYDISGAIFNGQRLFEDLNIPD